MECGVGKEVEGDGNRRDSKEEKKRRKKKRENIPVNCLPIAPSESKALGFSPVSFPRWAFAGVGVAPDMPPVALGPP